MKLSRSIAVFCFFVPTLAVAGCGDDDNRGPVLSPAQRAGVGAECTTQTQERDCNTQEGGQICLTGFKGGYCGQADCTKDEDCLAGSACVTLNGQNYCFLICTDKARDCNATRSADNESNCSANIDFVDGRKDVKVCVPPSSG